MKEKYSVELEVLTQKFKEKMTESAKETEDLAKKIKKASSSELGGAISKTSKSSINQVLNYQLAEVEKVQLKIKNTLEKLKLGEIDTKQAQKSLNMLLMDIEEINYQFERVSNHQIKANVSTEEMSILENIKVNSELISNNLKVAGSNTKELNDDLKDTENITQEIKKNTEKAKKNISGISKEDKKNLFKDAASNTRKFMLSLFSLSTVFSLISRLSSQAISNDDSLTARTSLLSNVMSGALAPAIKKVVDWGEYAVITLGKLLKYLFNIDILSNLTTKGLNNAASSAKKTVGALAGIDEITNLKSNTNGISADLSADLQAISEFKDKMKEVDSLFNQFVQTPLGSFLKNVGDKFRELPTPIKLVVTAGGLLSAVFGINAVKSLFGGLISSAGKAIEALGKAGLYGKMLAVTAIVVECVVIYEAVKKAKEHYDALQESMQSVSDTYDTLNQRSQESFDMLQKLNDEGELSNDTLNNFLNLKNDQLDMGTRELDQIASTITWWEKVIGISKEHQSAMQNSINMNYNLVNSMIDQCNQDNLSVQQKEKLIDSIEKEIDSIERNRFYLTTNKEAYEESGKVVEDLRTKLENLKNGNYDTTATVTVDANTSKAESKLKNFFKSSLGNAAAALFDVSGLNSFDVGTNYVPNDQIAVIHEGEAIVPKKYNPVANGTTNYYSSSNETNALLRELISTIEEKDYSPSIPIDEIGNASQSWNVKNRRIMGR